MLKNYILSFLSLDIYKVLVFPTGIIFVLAFVYPKNPSTFLRILLIVMTILLACALGYYYFKKYQLKRKVRMLKNAQVYESAVMLGQNFLAEDRMLVYQNRDIFEETYDQLISVKLEEGKKDTKNLRCHFQSHEVVIPVGSLLQSQRTVAFLLKKNPNIQLEGIEPTGDGLLHTIDQIKS